MATLSAATAQANQPRVTTDGTLITRMQTYVSTASFSAGDTVTMTGLKIPHGATTRSVWAKGSATDGSLVFKVGTTGTANQFGSTTLSAGVLNRTELASGTGYKVSVSDDASIRYETIMVTIDTTTSPTASISLLIGVDYVMDI